MGYRFDQETAARSALAAWGKANQIPSNLTISEGFAFVAERRGVGPRQAGVVRDRMMRQETRPTAAGIEQQFQAAIDAIQGIEK